MRGAADGNEDAPDELPAPHQAAICSVCGALLVFDEQMQLRFPTLAQLARMKLSPKWPLIEKIQATFRRLN